MTTVNKFVVEKEEVIRPMRRIVSLEQGFDGVIIRINGEEVIRFANDTDFVDRYSVSSETGLRNDRSGYVAMDRE